MESLKARLDSFSKSKRTKQSLSRSTSAFKWPHPSTYRATPNTLAEAGFYYDPSADDRDNVTCFMCGKELSDWDEDDDPFEIHWTKCRNTCAWAVVRCGLIDDLDESGNYEFSDPARLPTSKAMEKARLDTFAANKSWPHDSVRGHGANSKKMAKAGFVYTPQSSGDDTATCLYCNLSLSGWDEDDDPTEEHLKRQKKSGMPCAFFRASSARSLGKSTSRPPPSKASSKPPSRSVSQVRSKTDEEQPMSVGSDDELAPTSALATGTNGRTSKSVRSTGSRASSTSTKTPGSRRSTRGTGVNVKTPASKTTAGSEVEDTEGESDAGKRVSKTKRKPPIKAKRGIHVIEEEEEGAEQHGAQEEAETEPEVVVQKEKPKRGRPPKAKKPEAVEKEVIVEDANIEPEPMPVRKPHARTRSHANLDSESDVPIPSSSKLSQRKTKHSKSKETHDEEAIHAHSAEGTAKGSKKKMKKVKGEDSELSPDLPEPSTKASVDTKHKKISHTKGKKVLRSETNSEEETITTQEPAEDREEYESANTVKARAKAASSATHTSALKGSGKDKSRKRVSSTSDAGYATAELPAEAEPIDMDDEYRSDPLPQDMVPHSNKKLPEHQSNTQMKDPDSFQACHGSTLSRNSSAGVDVHMADRAPSITRDSGLTGSGRSTTSEVGPSRTSKNARTSGRTRVTPPSRASSSATDASSRSGQMGREKLKVIEVPSDGEEDEDTPIGPSRASREVKKTVRQVEPATSWTAAGTSVPKKAEKMQVEVVVQSKTRTVRDALMASAQESDAPNIEMDVDLPPTAAANGADIPLMVPPAPRSIAEAHAIPADAASSDDPGGDSMDIGDADSLESFQPYMALFPIQKLTSLTEEESAMTVEQYIRREIELQYQQFKGDAVRRIAQFKERASEARRTIEAS